MCNAIHVCKEIERAEKLDINKAKLEVTTRQLKKQLDEVSSRECYTKSQVLCCSVISIMY